MKKQTSCTDSIKSCLDNKYFSIAHLYNEEESMAMHIHDSYEIYYSISGVRQFLIDNKFYDINPGDLFVINEFESHYISKLDETDHERIVISICPEFLKSICTKNTDLDFCFTNRPKNFSHKVSLDIDQQKKFLYLINKITTAEDFGSDVIEYAAFLELITLTNKVYISNSISSPEKTTYQYNEQAAQIIKYIDQNITNEITIEYLAEHFLLSRAYICRIFKSATGTTINKYLSARRISMAKAMLYDGLNVNDVCKKCGFNDYSNFLKTFKKTVGISPKKYSQFRIG